MKRKQYWQHNLVVGLCTLYTATAGWAMVGANAPVSAMSAWAGSGENSIQMGSQSKATEMETIALGRQANAGTEKGISIGYNATTLLVGSVAIGDNAKAGSEDSAYYMEQKRKIRGNVAIGSSAHARDGMATAVGVNTEAKETYATAVGSEAHANTGARSAVVLGPYAYVGSEKGMTEIETYNGQAKIFNETLSDSSKAIKQQSQKTFSELTAAEKVFYLNKEERDLPDFDVDAYADKDVDVMLAAQEKHEKENEEKKRKRQYGSVAVGLRSQVTGFSSMAVGADAGARGNMSGSVGMQSRALADGAYAVGSWTVADGAAATAVGSLAHASGETSTAVGSYAMAEGTQAMALGHGAVASGTLASAIGYGSEAIAEHSVAIGAFSSTKGEASPVDGVALYTGERIQATDGVISVGTSERTYQNHITGEKQQVGEVHRRVAHVAGGMAPHDAVNVQQLDVVAQNLQAVGSTVQQVAAQVEGLQEDIASVGAMSAALGALTPLSYDPAEKTQLMLGVGYYDRKSALALGLSHQPDEDRMWHAGLAMQANRKMMIRAGVSWRLGGESGRKSYWQECRHEKPCVDTQASHGEGEYSATYRQGPVTSVYTLQQEIADLRAKNERLEAEIRNIRALIQSKL